MTNSIDRAPTAQSNAALDVADGIKSPITLRKDSESEISYQPSGKFIYNLVASFGLMGQKEKRQQNSGKASRQGLSLFSELDLTSSSGASHFSQAARTDNVHPYSNEHAYPTFSTHASLPSGPNMRDVGSFIPAYQLHPVLYEQHPMQQPYVPTVLPHGVVYPLHALSSYPSATMNANMTFGAPFPFYTPYVQQHQHQEPHAQHSAPSYQPLASNSSTHLNFHMSGQAPTYTQGYYPQTSIAASSKHPMPLNIPVANQRPPCGQTKKVTDVQKENKQRNSHTNYDVSKTIVDGSTPMRSQQSSTIVTSRSSQSPGSNILRGPPRKPKQSSHALWVGNLPPAANIIDLKDHFSQEATKELVSVFLISKSNCAFINYKTAAACAAALSRFNDSRFHGARLVCRLRHGTIPGGSSHEAIGFLVPLPTQASSESLPLMIDEDMESVASRRIGEARRPSASMPSRYFVVKSLTVEDLEHSRQTSIWATQTHNEDQLNRAYQDADDVYLIFSANKSGEYYGYARMMSPIQDDESLISEAPPRPDSTPDIEEPDVTPTPATLTAAKGRVINDSIRGTIFWEAESSDDESNTKIDGAGTRAEDTNELSPQLIGKPFRIRWLSTTRVPFHRTRGLRNPWNANREVKIARDGTEIEPEVGRKLLQLFHSNAQE